MLKKTRALLPVAMLVVAAFWVGRTQSGSLNVAAQGAALTAQDYAEIIS